MAPIPVNLSDPQGHFCCLKPFKSHTSGKYRKH